MAQPEASKSEWLDSALSRHEAPLLRYATRLLGNSECARDVVQDTFLKLCREDPARLDGRLVPWLFTVCRNRALDLRRKDKRLQPLDGGAEERTAPEPSPATTLERTQSLSIVKDLLATLPESQQEVLRLKFQDGLSYKEIAAITGRSVTHVGVLIHTGLKSI